MFIKELVDLGLNKGEAEVYSSLLQFGEASASEIAKRTNIGRTNVYEYANSLIKRGLISQFEQKNRIFFRADDPRLLKDLLDQRRRELRELETVLTEAMPRMETMFNRNANKPQTMFYHGETGYKEIMNYIFFDSPASEVYILVPDLDDFEAPEPKLRNALLRRQVKTILVANKGESILEFNKRDERELRKTSIVNKSKLAIKTDTIVYEDNLLFGTISKSNFAVNVIKSAELARLFKTAVSSLTV